MPARRALAMTSKQSAAAGRYTRRVLLCCLIDPAFLDCEGYVSYDRLTSVRFMKFMKSSYMVVPRPHCGTAAAVLIGAACPDRILAKRRVCRCVFETVFVDFGGCSLCLSMRVWHCVCRRWWLQLMFVNVCSALCLSTLVVA